MAGKSGKRRFELVEGTSNKFWEVWVDGAEVHTRYGRVGSTGQTTVKDEGTPDKAKRLYEKLVAEKMKKGYREAGGKGAVEKKKPAGGKKAPASSGKSKDAGPDETADMVRKLGKLVAAYAPSRYAKVRGAASFAELEEAVAIPAPLRALWEWADGFEELLVDRYANGWDLLSVHHAARELQMNREAADDEPFPEDLVPFAGNNGGDCLALDASGRVLYWDHEEYKASRMLPSLAALLKNTEKAIRAEELFGGPEQRTPGDVEKRVARILAKLRKEHANSVFGDDVFRLLSVDPGAVLELIRQAEPLGIAPSLLRKYEALAHLERKDADATYRSYLAYLDAIRAEGSTYNPPFSSLRVGFEELGKPAWAAEVAEIEGLAERYLLGPWLRACAQKADAARGDALRSLVDKIDERLDPADGVGTARAASLKAAALQRLGDAAGAESAWRFAAASDATVAAIWRNHRLLG